MTYGTHNNGRFSFPGLDPGLEMDSVPSLVYSTFYLTLFSFFYYTFGISFRERVLYGPLLGGRDPSPEENPLFH